MVVKLKSQLKKGVNVKSQLNAFISIIDVIPAAVYWKDKAGKYRGANKYMFEMVGISGLEEIVGKTDKDLVWTDAAEELQRNDKTVIKDKVTLEFEETILIAASNEERTYLSTKTPLYNESGKEIIGMIGVSLDITEFKNHQKAESEKEVAYRVSNAITMLSGNMAHEVRTPLAVIGINIDNLNFRLKDLLGDCVNDKERKEITGFTKNIKFAIDRANNIVTMLIVKLRGILDTHKKSILPAVEDLRLNSIKFDVSNALKEYPFFSEECDFVIWDGGKNEDFKYKGKPLLTKHMIFNLVKNALRAIKEVDRGKIYITLDHDKDFNYLIIKDTASGISPEILETLFQEFVGNSKEGAGLGLVFCKMTMELYGGDITCDTKDGEYTEFALSFPKV